MQIYFSHVASMKIKSFTLAGVIVWHCGRMYIWITIDKILKCCVALGGSSTKMELVCKSFKDILCY